MAQSEQTLVLIKPDAVRRGLVGEIISRFERKSLYLTSIQMIYVSAKQARQHYAEHEGKPFYERLISFITSGPVVAMIVEGEAAISVVRKLVGQTNAAEADPGTIRGDFSVSNSENIMHASDSEASAEREIQIFFGD